MIAKLKRRFAGYYVLNDVARGICWEIERFDANDNDSGKVIWIVRYNGTPFDSGRTFAEAKFWLQAALDNMRETS